MLYILPIEPLEERYSANWLKWMTAWLKRRNLDNHIILPDTYGKIQQGEFLDIVGTNRFKAKQLDWVMGLFQMGYIKDGDIFWVHDLWFPGIEMLAYVRDALGIKIKIYGMLHAGTYDPHDFITQRGMRQWGRFLESSWVWQCNGIFVATDFHKNLILDNTFCVPSDLFHVVPFPIETPLPVIRDTTEQLIVFPHRLAPEKGIDEWEAFIEAQPPQYNFEFVRTKDKCQDKGAYYELLKKAKYAVSFAKQETWGIAMQEATLCGCIPLVPNRLSYREMYPRTFQYNADEPIESIWNIIGICERHYDKALAQSRELANDFHANGCKAWDAMYAIMTEQA